MDNDKKYDPRNAWHQKLKYLPKHEWQEALKGLSKVVVSGRSMSKREFVAMMEQGLDK